MLVVNFILFFTLFFYFGVGPWGSITYGYDSVGDRLSKAVQGGSTTTYGYDEVNRLASATGIGFTWDDNGSMLCWGDGVDAWNYTYDPANRLQKVIKNDVISARYTYDADGRRVRSWDSVEGTVEYVYNGLNIIDEVSSGAHEKHGYTGLMKFVFKNPA